MYYLFMLKIVIDAEIVSKTSKKGRHWDDSRNWCPLLIPNKSDMLINSKSMILETLLSVKRKQLIIIQAYGCNGVTDKRIQRAC